MAIAVVAACVGAGPASAATGGDQWWYSAYRIDQAHADGWTGKGVKIAVIGQQINPDYPGLAGQRLTVDPSSVCPGQTVVTSDPTDVATHDTTVTALLIGNGKDAAGIRGIAPDADVTFIGYGAHLGSCTLPFDSAHPTIGEFGAALRRAIDDGARIVSTSTLASIASDDDAAVLAEAIARGIVIVAGTPNDLALATSGTSPWPLRGVVAVGAMDSTSTLQSDKTTGGPVVIPNVTVIGPGVDVSVIGSSWDTVANGTGSSIAAPIVAGMLAATAQKYPSATGNELIHALIRNTGTGEHAPQYDASSGFGYGAASLTSLLKVDPTTYPDQNPLLDKDPRLNSAPDLPSDAQLAAAQQAVTTADTPRSGDATSGGDPSAPPATSDSGSGLLTGVLIAGIVIAVLIVAAAIITIIVVTRRTRNPARKEQP